MNQHQNAISLARVNTTVVSLVIVFFIYGTYGCRSDQKQIASKSQTPDSSIEYQGQTYHYINIGGSTWLTKNLNVGIFIESSTKLPTDAKIYKRCADDIPLNCDLFGAIYPWEYAVSPFHPLTETYPNELSIPPQGICPNGWHVPSRTDWNRLIGFCGGEENAAIRLSFKREADIPSSYGLEQLFDLKRFKRKNFMDNLLNNSPELIPKEYSSYFISSSLSNSDSSRAYFFTKWENETFSRHFIAKSLFGSVRCVRNETTHPR